MVTDDAFKLTVEIPGKLNERLDRLARATKRTKTELTVWALERMVSPPEGPNG